MIIRLTGALEERAPMQEGEDGFICAQFPDKMVSLDISNLLLSLGPAMKKKPAGCMKKPAGCMKKPAGVMKKPAGVMEKEDTDDEEEEEGESEEEDEEEGEGEEEEEEEEDNEAPEVETADAHVEEHAEPPPMDAHVAAADDKDSICSPSSIVRMRIRMRILPHGDDLLSFSHHVSLMRCVHAQDYKSKKYAVLWYKNSNSVGIRRKFGDKKQIFNFGGMTNPKNEMALRAIGGRVLRLLDTGSTEAQAAAWAKEKALA